MLLFTDGLSNRDADKTPVLAEDLKASGVEVFTVSLDSDIDLEELHAIASSPLHAIRAPDKLHDTQGWQHAINQAVYGICNLPVPTWEPPGLSLLHTKLSSWSSENFWTQFSNFLILS